MNNQNKILVEKRKDDKDQEIHIFYILKKVSWAQDRGLSSWYSGHEVQCFSVLPGKRYEITPDCDIFLLVQPEGTLELCLPRKLSQKGTRQENYPFTKHPHLADWWIGEVKEKDLELLITNDFTHRTSLGGRSGEIFQEAYSLWITN